MKPRNLILKAFRDNNYNEITTDRLCEITKLTKQQVYRGMLSLRKGSKIRPDGTQKVPSIPIHSYKKLKKGKYNDRIYQITSMDKISGWKVQDKISDTQKRVVTTINFTRNPLHTQVIEHHKDLKQLCVDDYSKYLDVMQEKPKLKFNKKVE